MKPPNQELDISLPWSGEGTAGTQVLENEAMPTDDTAAMDLESDPSSLANQAAIELDNLILGRGVKVDAVLHLADLIENEVSGSAKRAVTIGVMKRAISNALTMNPPSSLAKVEDVQKKALEVVGILKKIASDIETNHQSGSPDDIKQMRAFCVAFSIQRSATDRPRSNKPQHPYRR